MTSGHEIERYSVRLGGHCRQARFQAQKECRSAETTGHFAVSDIKKAAAFANSIGGLDKAIAVLQILKVAKEVQ